MSLSLPFPPYAERTDVDLPHFHSEEEEDSDEDDDDDDEDETDALVRELEKIRRERAEEKARQEAEANASNTAAREADIATSNPLLNLAAALGQNPAGLNTTKPGTFQVKKRWDDGASTCWFHGLLELTV